MLPHMLSEAAFHLAADAAAQTTVAFACLQKSHLWIQRLVILHDVADRLGATLLCTHNPFPPLESGGEGRLRDFVRQQSPSLVVIDNLGKLKSAQADQVDLQVADDEDRAALAQARAAVKGFDVEVVVVHHVDYDYAHELLRDGCVDVTYSDEADHLFRGNSSRGIF